jgi:endonuclease/exonuclease/phosphatase family metal-dependent hydrolase
MAQAQALVDIHRQACGHAAHPPLDDESGGPFQNKVHTTRAILCGDFNFETSDPEYNLIQSADAPAGATRLMDAWPLLHGTQQPHDPTFRLFDSRYGPLPICCDFVFVSSDLQSQITRMSVDLKTRASDHQPVLLELGKN